MFPPEDDESGGRVRVTRGSNGNLVYQDPDNRYHFISKQEAVRRLNWDTDQGSLADSFGNKVGPGILKGSLEGGAQVYPDVIVRSFSFEGRPQSTHIGDNQELVERWWFVNADGSLSVGYHSYGRGNAYHRDEGAGSYRAGAARALGLPEDQRLPSAELKEALVFREFIIKEYEDIAAEE
jgi:hypothetical protein